MTAGRSIELSRVCAVATVSLVAVLVGCGDTSRQSPDRFGFWAVDTSSSPDTGPDTESPPPPDTGLDADTSDGGTDPGAPTGAPCSDAEECAGDTCIANGRYGGGYCSDVGCRPGGCAGSSAVCVEFSDGSSGCFDGCSTDDDCRTGYQCRPTGTGARTTCRPGPGEPNFEETRRVLGVQCDPESVGPGIQGERYRFTFQLSEEAQAFLMVPYVTDGRLRPFELKTPDRTINLRTEYNKHNTRVTSSFESDAITGIGTFGKIAFDWPIGVPYAPKYSDLVVPGGRYVLRVDAEKTTPCMYVVEKRSGTELDLNFYFATSGDLDAESAPSDEDFQEAVSWMKRLFGKAGIEVGTTRYFGLREQVARKFRVVDGRQEANQLVAQGEPPTASLSGHLSVDVFLVDTLQLRNQGGRSVTVLGLSAGIPGAAGVHGNARNGLVFQVTDLGFDNRNVGLVMAHEIGHFLGLRHTTEIFRGTDRGQQLDVLFGSVDPIEDTAICENISDKVRRNPSRCADWSNLMFPVAPSPGGDQDASVTAGQRSALRASPLVTGR